MRTKFSAVKKVYTRSKKVGKHWSKAIAAEVDARVQALFLAAEYEATKLESKRGNKQQKKEAARIRKEKKVAVKKAKAAAKVAAEARAAEKAEVEKLIKKYNFKVGFLYL